MTIITPGPMTEPMQATALLRRTELPQSRGSVEPST
jgi:hypothetical protein